MKKAMTHWEAAPNASSERAFVENPPVGNVVRACPTASYSVIAESRPVHARNVSVATMSAVSKM